MAKSLRSKRKRKFRALKRIKYKPKIDAKMKEIALEVATDKTGDEENIEVEGVDNIVTQKVDEEGSASEEIQEDGNDDIDMEVNGSVKPKKLKKSSSIPYNLLSQRKLRKMQMKNKQKKGFQGKKKFLKW